MRPSAWSALAVVALMLLASGLVAGGSTGRVAPGHPAPSSVVPAAPSPPSTPPTPTASSSGRGTFFVNYPQPTAPSSSPGCRYQPMNYLPVCQNDTGNPSIAVTPSGVVATAYTAFADVNPCAAALNLTATVIGVDVSTTGGSSWVPPLYLDNPVCSDQFNYTSAMMPAIASLANGTLVLAYVEYNLSASASTPTANVTCQGDFWFPAPLPCIFTAARLVVSESYNSGANWTVPSVVVASQNTSVNASGTSWIPMLPTLATVGDTVYLAWTNYTNATFGDRFPFGPLPISDTSVEMVTSTNGGGTWGASVTLPTVLGFYYGQPTSVAYAPSIAVASNGTVFVAYATNLTSDDNYLCNPYFACGFLNYNQSMDVVVAQSTNNGSSFSYSTAASAVPVEFGGFTWIGGYPGSIVSPAPSIAIDQATGLIYVAYAGGEIGNLCFPGGFCFSGEYYENVWLAASPDNGTSWTNTAVGDQALSLATGVNNSMFLMTPSVGVGANGTVYVNAVFDNGTVCAFFTCSQWTDLLFESTDQGVTFLPPFQVDSQAASIDGGPLWDGFTTSMAMYQGVPWFAWTQEIDPTGGSSFCYGPSAVCYSQVIVSTLFVGTGLIATFNETGLPTGYNWSLTVNGNPRAGPAGTNLSVSGVPVGEPLTWAIPGMNSTSAYGIRYVPTTAPTSPYVLTASTTVSVTFAESALLNLTVIPTTSSNYPFSCAAPYYGGYGYDCANQNVTPALGVTYVPVGVPIGYGVFTIPWSSLGNCYQCLNLSFLAWTGVGNGSWNTTSANGTATIWGPVNETLSFNLLGFCSYGVCSNATYNYTFAESGLPNGTNWTMTFGDQTQTSNTPFLGFNGSGGPIPFTIWVVPYNATLEYVGTAAQPSPVTALQGGSDTVTFNLEPIARESSDLSVSATGLPSGVTSWGFTLGTTQHAIPSSGAAYTVPNGPVTLNAAAVYGPNGTGAYPTGFNVLPETTGATSSVVALGGTLDVTSPTIVTAQFAPEYWLSVTNSSGGSVSAPSGQWVHAGATVTNLTATPDPGFAFVGWSGTGSGSVTSTSPIIDVQPTGPVSELATFVAVVPTFSLFISASGVQAGVPVTVSVGVANYTEVAPFTIGGLQSGSYAVSIPTVYPNGTSGVRYLTTGVSSSLPLSGGSIDITSNGTLTITYTEEVTLVVGAAGNGTTTPDPGSYWETAGVATTLTATPNSGFVFVSWNGTGPGSVTTSSASTIQVTATGLVTETPVFTARIVPPPATFALTVTETGLPTGTIWAASVGSNGASGTGSLVIAGLNGTYTVIVPTVLGGPGVRYVPTNASPSTTVTSNTTLTVTFTTEYAFTVFATPGGSAGPLSEWVTSGGTVGLTATANASYEFANWTGTGTSSYSGTTQNLTITVTSPVTELATFVPSASKTTTSTSGGPGAWALAIGLLVVLLVVGLAAGLLLGRSRRPPSAATEAPAPESVDSSTVPVWSEHEETAPTPAPSDADDGGDTVYGGGPG
jgi:List-Bact-rpt repeat protein